MLNDQLLEDFMQGFYGYGTFRAPIWFVGMEEGGGGSLEQLAGRIAAWDTRGRHELEDVAEYHVAIGIDHFWKEPIVLQPTWGRLIHVLLSSKGLTPTTQEVKAFQRDTLGRAESDTCLAELLPLPSPNMATWLYSSLSTLPSLASRQTYKDHYSGVRSLQLRARITEYQPAVVVFYGLAYLPLWQNVADGALQPVEPGGFFAGRRGDTTFVAMKHPAARGVTNAYFHNIGQWIAARAQAN
jgi:hypothetical protein